MATKNYISIFSTTSEYEDAYEVGELDFPNVSLTEDTGDVHYEMTSPHYYSKDYLTFEAITDGTVTIKASNSTTGVKKQILYSVNNGSTWSNGTTTTASITLATLKKGEKLLVKGNNDSYSYNSYYNYFGGTAQVKIYGNIMSLIYGDNFKGQTSFPLNSNNNFFQLFHNYTNLIDSSNLILPATTLVNSCYATMFYGCTSLTTPPSILPASTLVDSCYYSMFNGCTSLTAAPILPATTLVNKCYNYMFSGCSNLNYIKAMFTTTPSTDYTSNWVSGVSSTGTFVKNSAAGWTTTGVNGIPTGWTVETASA